jgi:hypothetical protein
VNIRDIIVTSLLVAISSLSLAQQEQTVRNLTDYLEYLVEIGFEEYEAADFSEEIVSLSIDPVEINRADESELGRLFFLSPFQIKSIISFIRINGPLKSKFELAYIPGFDSDLARLCSEYIVISNYNQSYSGNNYTRLTGVLIYSDRDKHKYAGSDIKYATRVMHRAGKFSFGCTLDKDQGEKFIDDNNRPEFLSAYINFPSKSSKTQYFIGDYRVRFGQGLTVWHGYSPGISPVNPNLVKGSSRIATYSSSDENNFFRGMAISSTIGKTNIHIYLSSNKIDASTEIRSDSIRLVRSLYDSGIHNTISGKSKKDALTEYSAGINLNRNLEPFNIGLSLTGTRFSDSINPEIKSGSSMDFKGKNNLVLSADYAASINKVYLYGEAALTSKAGVAFIQGLKLIPDDRVKLNILYSYTSLLYQSFHGHILGKETVNNFRKSMLANITVDLAPGLNLAAGFVNHKDLWYAYRSAEFPQSTRYITELAWQPDDKILLKYSFKYKKYIGDAEIERGIEPGILRSINSSRLHIDIKPAEKLKLSARCEITCEPHSGKRGYLAYQGIRLNPEQSALSLIIRHYTYYIDNYNTRIYAWEDDLLFNPSVPALYGKGNRNYFVLDYHPDFPVSIRFKYAISNFVHNNEETYFNEYRIQVRIRFHD